MPGSKTSRVRAGSKTRRRTVSKSRPKTIRRRRTTGSKTVRRRRVTGSKSGVGSKRQVYNGSASRTSGGLTRTDLMKNRRGKVVSRRKHAMGQRLKRYLR